ncbi:protein translocase subunit SecF [Canibacter sp. lx-72]|uniref:protein translocase subunit SecF n=1 Tax=Canibacter zhuwentaonis TaxID=2837491 RepID=UPI001BDC963C|nr:protein translocase subunit SecF [Canibacter zhuwentaonis]MBT1017886.1 protein translocase subunit SecF [Canibacter zhuwentaonis]MBT1035049.1 protein translocase subunit SecF [Canibacter zhuwentaonis]
MAKKSFGQFGNDLYIGKKSFNFVGKRKTWYAIAIISIVLSVAAPFVHGGYSLGIEFTGGSQFQIHVGADRERETQPAKDVVQQILPGSESRVTLVGQGDVHVQTEQLEANETNSLAKELAKAYNVAEEQVTSSFIGAVWGQDVTRQALIAVGVFLLFATIVMAIYFRTWKMSVAALIALLHDLVLTAGVYGLAGFEVTPAAVIGFLTILGYSLYDTVVVFDKIRENTRPDVMGKTHTFAESVNLAVNQTLVRSINTSVVALLPVGSILFIGAFILGAGTLRDIALSLFIGIMVGAYSTIFIAAPVYSHMRENEPEIKKHDTQTLSARA